MEIKIDATLLTPIAQIDEFLGGIGEVEFSAHGGDCERYAHISRVLKCFDYPRRMVETAAHLTGHVFPRLPVPQWALSMPKRLRYFMQLGGTTLDIVLLIYFRVIEQRLQPNIPDALNVDKTALHIGVVGPPVRFVRKPATSTKSYTGRVVRVGIASGFRSVG